MQRDGERKEAGCVHASVHVVYVRDIVTNNHFIRVVIDNIRFYIWEMSTSGLKVITACVHRYYCYAEATYLRFISMEN